MVSLLLALSCKQRDLHQSSMSDAQLDRRDRSEAVSVDRQQSRNWVSSATIVKLAMTVDLSPIG